MTTGKVIDFDAYRAERANREHEAGEPPTIVVGGKVYTLPRELPAALALDIVRLKKDIGVEADAPASLLLTAGEQLFGPDTFREILVENQMGVVEMGDLITQAFRTYEPESEDGTVPNSEAPEAGQTTEPPEAEGPST
jgi:hypothetical protein